MILGLLILLSFQLLGEFTVTTMNLFVPGPVMGMVFFFIALLVYPPLKNKVEDLTRFINSHLALFFVPAGVGLIEYFDLFDKYGWAMALTLIASSVITLAVTGWFFNFLIKASKAELPHD